MWQHVFTHARQLVTPTRPPKTRVLLFVNKQDDDIVHLVRRVCDAKHFDVVTTTLHDADPAVLATFMITTVPVCIFVKPDQWTYIMPDVTHANLVDFVTCIAKCSTK